MVRAMSDVWLLLFCVMPVMFVYIVQCPDIVTVLSNSRTGCDQYFLYYAGRADPNCALGHVLKAVSYTHLTLPTNREV